MASRPSRAKLRAMVERKARKIAESYVLNNQAFVERSDYLPQGWGILGPFGGVNLHNTQNDRKDGDNRPFIESDVDAGYVRGMARWITGVNCPGVGISENLKNYVVGTGYKFQAVSKHPEVPKGLIPEVQAYIDRMLDANDFLGDLDREIFWRFERDGEVFCSLHPSKDGQVVDLRIVEPEFIIDPKAAPWREEELEERYGMDLPYATSWSHGVHTDAHDVQAIHGYCAQWETGDEYDYLPKAYCVHAKNNVDRNVKRGMSSFYPAWSWLNQQERLLRNTGDGASQLAAISYIIQYITATQAQARSLREQNSDFAQTFNGPNGSRTEYKRIDRGANVLSIPGGTEYKEGPHGAERGNAFLMVVQGILRQVATRFCMTEGMISGDDSNNNLACHDQETECLTTEGWKRYDQLRYDIPIATRNPITGTLEFQLPRAIHIYRHAGPMVHFEGPHNLDVMVTANHRMWVAKKAHARIGGKMQLTGEMHPFRFIQAGDLAEKKSQHYMHFSAGPLQSGDNPEFITIPRVDRTHRLTAEIVADIRTRKLSQNAYARKHGISRGAVQKAWHGETWKTGQLKETHQTVFPTTPFLKFMGYWLSEGWTVSRSKNYSIGIAQNEGKEAEEISAVLRQLGFSAYRRTVEKEDCTGFNATADQHKWTFSHKSLYRWLRENGGINSHTKRIPIAIKSLSPACLEVLLAALISGDGTDKCLSLGTRKYFSVSKQLADDVQEIAIRCGYLATISPPSGEAVCHTVTIKRTEARLRGIHPSRQSTLREYIGPVWCCTVDNGLMLTRRNGRVAITGNSSVEAGSRFYKFAEARQSTALRIYLKIFWLGLKHAFRAGVFRKYGLTWEQFRELVDIVGEAPDIEARDPLQQTQRRQALQEVGILSKKTFAAQEGLDYEQEQANLEAEPKPEPPPGQAPPPQPGSGEPGGGDGGQPPTAPPSPSGEDAEYAGLSRQQWLRNRKAIQDVLNEVADRAMRPAAAIMFLQALGLAADRAKALVDDAVDGTAPQLPSGNHPSPGGLPATETLSTIATKTKITRKDAQAITANIHRMSLPELLAVRDNLIAKRRPVAETTATIEPAESKTDALLKEVLTALKNPQPINIVLPPRGTVVKKTVPVRDDKGLIVSTTTTEVEE